MLEALVMCIGGMKFRRRACRIGEFNPSPPNPNE
jgi:hypothetical protein